MFEFRRLSVLRENNLRSIAEDGGRLPTGTRALVSLTCEPRQNERRFIQLGEWTVSQPLLVDIVSIANTGGFSLGRRTSPKKKIAFNPSSEEMRQDRALLQSEGKAAQEITLEARRRRLVLLSQDLVYNDPELLAAVNAQRVDIGSIQNIQLTVRFGGKFSTIRRVLQESALFGTSSESME